MNTQTGIFVSDPARRPRQFGRIFAPNREWLGRQPVEAILDPGIAIVDAHHHVWDFPGNRYLIDELAADLQSGHNVVATVFVECEAMYRQDGPVAMRPVGETEFAAGVAAMSDSGHYGPARVASGIVGFADLALGDAVQPVLEAHVAAGGGRFRGVRYAAGWDASDVIGNSHGVAGPQLLRHPGVRAGFARVAALGLWLHGEPAPHPSAPPCSARTAARTRLARPAAAHTATSPVPGHAPGRSRPCLQRP